MKILILAGVLMMSALSFTVNANEQTNTESHACSEIHSNECHTCTEIHTNTSTDTSHAYTEIHTDELKSWYDQGKHMIVLDARTSEYFDGTLLPQVIWLPYNAPEKEIKETLPAKDTTIVVYCWGPSCPASKWLADRLIAEGYTNVYKYPEGLQEWMQHGLPTIKK